MDKITKVLIKSFITNILLSLIKIIVGFIGASGALIADGIHSISDSITDIFALIGNKLSLKPADDKHPFGHGKIEYVTAFIIGTMITIIGILVIYKSFTHQNSVPNILVSVVTLFVIASKFLLSKYILKKGNQYESNILIASGSESLTDVISSFVVLIAVLLAQLKGIFVYADSVAMVIVGILILKIAFNILKNNFSSLLGEQVIEKQYLHSIKEIILNNEKVLNIETLVILKYGPYYQMNCEIFMDKNMKLEKVHEELDKIEKNLQKFDQRLKNIIIHVSPYNS